MKDNNFYKNLISTTNMFILINNRQKALPYHHAIINGFKVDKLSLFDTFAMSNLRNNDKIKVQSFAKMMFLKRSTATEILNRLEKLGIIERIQNKSDRRSSFVGLTAEVKKRYDAISTEFYLSYDKRLEKAFKKLELKQIYLSLEEINHLYEKIRIINNIETFSHIEIHTNNEYFDRYWNGLSQLSNYHNYILRNVPYEQPPLFKKANFSFFHIDALLYLEAAGEAISLSCLSKKLSIKTYQATRIVNKLVETNFARRVKRNDNSKTVYVELTEIGEKTLIANNEAYINYLMNILNKALSDDELDKMLEIYNFLINIFENKYIYE